MQSIAQETNDAITAFVSAFAVNGIPANESLLPSEYRFVTRWFTPSQELPLCGHGALATAYALYGTNAVPREKSIQFYSNISHLSPSKLLVEARYDSASGSIELECNSRVCIPFVSSPEQSQALVATFGIVEPSEILFVGEECDDLLVHVTSAAFLRLGSIVDCSPLLVFPHRRVSITSEYNPADVHGTGLAEILLMCDTAIDFISRVFLPRNVFVEDQVTGTAHCLIFPYWLKSRSREQSITQVSYQCSKRGGIIQGRVDVDKVYLKGACVQVSSGMLTLAGL